MAGIGTRILSQFRRYPGLLPSAVLCDLVLMQPPAEAARVGKGFPLFEGDVISTSDRSFSVFTLAGGTKMTSRPNSVFAIEGFSKEEESGTDKLFKGGFKTLAGLIAKENPKAYLLEALVATTGIRGTKLDARLYDGECSTESTEAKKGVVVANTPVVTRASLSTGKVSATGAGGRLES